MQSDFSKLGVSLGVSFADVKLLKEALTHRSYLNENTSWDVPHNERLEYLGDAVLELIVSEELFHRFKDSEEGELTSIRAALVNTGRLGAVAHTMQLDEWVFLSRGEAKDSGKAREIILANAFEAVLGAVYCDQGYTAAKGLVTRFLLPSLTEVMEKKLYVDPKSLLQEIVQEKKKITPSYKVLRDEGPDHQKRFFVGVFFEDTLVAQGDGFSKQEAETAAARSALKIFETKE